MADRIGPLAKVTVTEPLCDGCVHLETKYWKEYLENDDYDSGTTARCKAKPNEHGGWVITAYYSKHQAAPEWCPYLESENNG